MYKEKEMMYFSKAMILAEDQYRREIMQRGHGRPRRPERERRFRLAEAVTLPRTASPSPTAEARKVA
jgi:hypothetical protein